MIDRNVSVGEDVTLKCTTAGSPPPEVTWYKDGKDLVITDRHFFAAQNQIMIVVDIRLSDAGL